MTLTSIDPTPFDIVDGYDRTQHPRRFMVRRLTLAEVKALGCGDHCKFVDLKGQLRELKINGAPKTWKTRPDEVSVPVKYGMYEYGRLDTVEALTRLVKVVG